MATKAETIRWVGDEGGHLVLIDQTRLPLELVELECRDVEAVWEAIKQLRVRGAPAIGIAAAYGVVIGQSPVVSSDEQTFFARLDEVSTYLATSRPTAVNLFWALERMKRVAETSGDVSAALLERLFAEAALIQREDIEMCAAIGRYGAELIEDGTGVLTHCNAGALATAGDGTALSVFFAAAAQGKQTRHSCGKTIFDIADIVVDSCAPAEDASVSLKNHQDKIGPVSTMAFVTCVWMTICTVAEILAERGVRLFIHPSHNVPGDTTAHQRLDAALAEYKRRVSGV